MAKKQWNPGAFINPVPAVMVSCGTMEESNIITIAWTGVISSNPSTVYISIRPERHSYEIIKKTGEFVINLTSQDLVYATDWCGVRSGKDVDKFKEMKLTKEKCNFVRCPGIAESPVSIECKVKEIKEFGVHHMFIAEVVSINPDEKYIDEKGALDISKCNLAAYANGRYFALGEQLGTFGYSVRKNKK